VTGCSFLKTTSPPVTASSHSGISPLTSTIVSAAAITGRWTLVVVPDIRRRVITTRTSALPQMPTTKMTGAPKIHSAATRSRPASFFDEDELTATTGGDDDDAEAVDVRSVASYDSITLLHYFWCRRVSGTLLRGLLQLLLQHCFPGFCRLKQRCACCDSRSE